MTHSKHDRYAGRLERVRAETFLEECRPRGFGRTHRSPGDSVSSAPIRTARAGCGLPRCYASCGAETGETSLVESGLGGRPRAETAAAPPNPPGAAHLARLGGFRIRRRGSGSRVRADADVRWRLRVGADERRRALADQQIRGCCRARHLPPLNIRNGPSGLRICGASLPELPPAAPRSRDLRRARLSGRIRTAPAAGNGGRRR